MFGSSPLARGLPLDPLLGFGVGRIIPARAGFTSTPTAWSSTGWDHPRSRGVYPRAPPSPAAPSGSSPLARGLRRPRTARGGTRRIIPARAGFTDRVAAHRRRRQDHPRSRGVYSGCLTLGDLAAGSSPLARGLHTCHRDYHSRGRIIPARAGFTLRILGIPTNPHSTRPLPPSLPTRGPLRRVARAPPSFGAPPAADGRDLEDADATRPPRVSDPGSDTTPTCAGEWRRRPARSGSRRSGGSAPPRSRG